MAAKFREMFDAKILIETIGALAEHFQDQVGPRSSPHNQQKENWPHVYG